MFSIVYVYVMYAVLYGGTQLYARLAVRAL